MLLSSAFSLSDYLFKLLLIGDSGVGKSCLLLRFAVSYEILHTHTHGSDSGSYCTGDLTVKELHAKGEGCNFSGLTGLGGAAVPVYLVA